MNIITEVGIISLATIGSTCLLQLVSNCFKGTRESRCKEVSCCCWKCINETLSAQDIIDLEMTEQNQQHNQNNNE